MRSHLATDTFTIPLRTVYPCTVSPVPVQVRKLSGTSAMGYSRDGLENRLNNAYVELDKKIEVTLQGCSLAENAGKDFREVRTRTYDGLGEGRAYCRDPLSPCISLYILQSLSIHSLLCVYVCLYLHLSPSV